MTANTSRQRVMVTVASVEEVLCSLLAEARGSTSDAVRTELGDAGEIDSLEGVELIVAAEQRFGIEVQDSEITTRRCRSIPALAELIASRIGA